MSEIELQGACLCGTVAYTVRGEARHFFHCHCRRCRKVTGSAHASNLFVAGGLEWRRGEDEVRNFKLPEARRFTNSFCDRCGSRLPRFMPDFGTVMIPAGSLESDSPIRPQARIFTGSRAVWSCRDDGLPSFDEYAG